jgi:hypothetical protein
MKKTIILSFIILFNLSVFCQSSAKDEISGTGKYYYGTGISADENQARQEALAEISEMIAVNVASRFEFKSEEKDKTFKEQASSVIKTYSIATLSNVESLRTVLPDGNGKVELFCYIPKEEVKKLYNERKELVYKMYLSARQSEETGNLSHALKNYYFGLVLLKSIPEVQIQVENTNLTIEIPKAINQILQGVKFEVISDRMLSEKEREIRFNVQYDGKPVSQMEFRFWDGSQITGSERVRDGIAVISLYGSSLRFEELKCYIEYENFNARKETNAIEDLWELVIRPEFNNLVTVPLIMTERPVKIANTKCILSLDSQPEILISEKILINACRFLDVVEKCSDVELVQTYGSDEFLKEKIQNYIKFNKPTPLNRDIPAVINKTAHGYEVRKILVHHKYPTINKQATEYLVLDFNEQGNLIDFNLCITDDLYEKFVKQAEWGNDWGNRQEIIKFIEKYRTAYHTRDIATIDLMFAEEALILVGRKIEPRQQTASEIGYQPLPGQPQFEQIKLTKQEYITRQKQIFDYQQDISIDFSTFEIVKKNNAEGVYGVEMRQNYSSTTYADEGYLFLMVDFTKNDPLIYIRAWQPNEWDTNALINTSNFRIYK